MLAPIRSVCTATDLVLGKARGTAFEGLGSYINDVSTVSESGRRRGDYLGAKSRCCSFRLLAHPFPGFPVCDISLHQPIIPVAGNPMRE